MSQSSSSREPQEVEERLRKKLKDNKEKLRIAEQKLRVAEMGLRQTEKRNTELETLVKMKDERLQDFNMQSKEQLSIAEQKLKKAEMELMQAYNKNVELGVKVQMLVERLKDLNQRCARQEAENKTLNIILINRMAQMQQQMGVLVEKVGNDRQNNERIEPAKEQVSQAKSFKKHQKEHEEDSDSSIKPIYQHEQSQLDDRYGTIGCVKFDVIVPIKKSLIDKNTVALFQNRLVVAKILSFYGYRGVVCQLLQKLSHGMRAIAVKTQEISLQSEKFTLEKHLQKQLACGNFDYLLPWHFSKTQHQEIYQLILKKIQLERLTQNQLQKSLGDAFPQLWIDLLECQGKYAEKKVYVDNCRLIKPKIDVDQMQTKKHVYGYVFDLFKQMLNQKQLVYGTKTHILGIYKLQYEGGMDRKSRACGFGQQSVEGSLLCKFIGTFLNDMRHGIGKPYTSKCTISVVVEYKEKGPEARYWINDDEIYLFPKFAQDQIIEKVERFAEEFFMKLVKK